MGYLSFWSCFSSAESLLHSAFLYEIEKFRNNAKKPLLINIYLIKIAASFSCPCALELCAKLHGGHGENLSC